MEGSIFQNFNMGPSFNFRICRNLRHLSFKTNVKNPLRKIDVDNLYSN